MNTHRGLAKLTPIKNFINKMLSVKNKVATAGDTLSKGDVVYENVAGKLYKAVPTVSYVEKSFNGGVSVSNTNLAGCALSDNTAVVTYVLPADSNAYFKLWKVEWHLKLHN